VTAEASTLAPEIAALAEAMGVETRFRDWQRNDVQVAPGTVVAVLAALGVDASTPDSAAAALTELRLRPWRAVLPGCTVVRQSAGHTATAHLRVDRRLAVWIEFEVSDAGSDSGWPDSGPPARIPVPVSENRNRCVLDGQEIVEFDIEIPGSLPLGWHTLCAELCAPEDGPAVDGPGPLPEQVRAPLVVVPDVLQLPAAAARRSWGWLTQLYQVRSRRSWGIGDLRDLADLAQWSGRELGAAFVLVNPLHACSPVSPLEPSPYLPTTRRFANPLYLRIDEIPEYALLTQPTRAEIDALAPPVSDAAGALLDRDAAWAAKLAAIERLAAVDLTDQRRADLAAFAAREGQPLEDFATWCALVEAHGPQWRQWPEGLRTPDGDGISAERDRLAGRVELYRRMQWWTDAQLDAAQRAAVMAGMGVGVVHDLAVGVHPDGFDAWELQGVLAERVSVGAPPDSYNQQGQDWSQPPLRPDALVRLGYAPYRDMLRSVLRHAGGVRIDHIAGLFRLWWIPVGADPREGAYVRYDHDAMVGILALEAQRAGALVIGEDLGTVEDWVREYLVERGIAGTSVLWFEHDEYGRPLPPEKWRPHGLASVTTHDLPPTAGVLAAEHVRIRAELGLLTRPIEVESAHAASERRAWLSALHERDLLPAAPDADTFETVRAFYRYVAATPSTWVGVALVDAVGDVRAQNQPGTSDEYPNWRVPLARRGGEPVLLDDLYDDEHVRALASAVADSRSQERPSSRPDRGVG